MCSVHRLLVHAILFLLSHLCFSQVNKIQLEGFLESYHPNDHTSTYIGKDAGKDVSGSLLHNTFVGRQSGTNNTFGFNNTFIGSAAGDNNISGDYNTAIGYNAGASNGFLNYATAIGANAVVATSNTIMLGRPEDKTIAPGTLNVGNAPLVKADLGVYANSGNADLYLEADLSTVGINLASGRGNPGSFPNFFIAHYDGSTYHDRLIIRGNGRVVIKNLAGTAPYELCWNDDQEVSVCASSVRYKKDIQDYTAGLELLEQLRPVSYIWKESEKSDLGFIAEEVAEIDERLTTHLDGQIEGVRYDRLIPILVNSIKEQQVLIQQLSEEIQSIKKELARERTKTD